jgi:hypothetical protein
LYSFANKTLFLPDFRPQLQRWIIKSTIFQMTRHICHSNLNKDSNRFYNLWRDKLRKNLMHTFFHGHDNNRLFSSGKADKGLKQAEM